MENVDLKDEPSTFGNLLLADSLPPSELIALKEYYDKTWKGSGGGCKPQGYYDAIKISEAIEKRLHDMAVNFL